MTDTPEIPDDILATLNSTLGGFNKMLGLRFTNVTDQEVCAQIPVGPHLHQPYGLVHGGVYAAMVETLASVGAAVQVMSKQLSAVGLENSTSFLRGVREGILYGRATSLATGRRTHVWQVAIHDGKQRLVATGRVRMLCIPQDTAVAGATLTTQQPSPPEPPLEFSIASPEQAPMQLLLEADPSEQTIRKYLSGATCYIAQKTGKTVGVYVLGPPQDDGIELLNIAVSPDFQKRGLGTILLDHAIATARAQGVAKIHLGTGAFGHQLAFYQKAGFRVTGVDRDFFVRNYEAPVVESGLQHLDMLRLTLDLQ